MFNNKKNIFIGLFLLYTSLSFLLPFFLKPQLISLIEENTKTLVQIKSISFNPFVFSLSLNDVSLWDEQNARLISFDALSTNIEPTSLLYGALHIKNITLVKPKVFVTYNKNKSINLLNSFTSQSSEDTTSEESNSLPRVIVDNITIQEGSLEYKDYTRKELFVFTLNDIGFSLLDIDTGNMNSSQAQMRVYSTLGDGGFVDFRSNVHSLNPFMVSGSVAFEASKLYTQWKYFKEELKLEVADGKISFEGEYAFNSADLNATTISHLNVSLEKLRIIPKDDYRDILNLDLLHIDNITVKPFSQSVNIDKIGLEGLSVHVKRSKDKNIDWLRYTEIKYDTTTTTKEQKSGAPWSVDIRDVALENIKLAFIDEGMKEASTTSIEKVNIYAQAISIKTEESVSVVVKDSNLSIDGFLVVNKLHNEKLLAFKHFVTHGIKVNTQKKSVEISKAVLDGFNVYLQRYKNKSLNIESFFTKSERKKAKTTPKTEEYHILLKEFFLSDAGLSFKDRSLAKVQTQRVDKFNLHLYDIDSQKQTWLSYKGGLRLNKSANLYLKGKVRHTPLKQEGTFTLKNLKLQFLNPYLKEKSYLHLSDGEIFFKGSSRYAVSSKSADLELKSSFVLSSLTLNDVREKTPLLFLERLQTDSITLELSPNRLYIDEVNVANFYVDAMIDENHVMNFSKLSKPSLASKKTLKKESNQDIFPVTILKVNLASSSAKFSDYSIPIKFSTYIHNLDGVIYAISNTQNETSYINISGDVDEYGSAKLEGSIASSNPKSYTDLNLNFKNLDLNSLSGYSASFAGHEIDSGKLYLDLGYDIFDSELKGSNSIMMKNVVLGKEIDDENITVLPLGFVLGLLEDSDGIIDIEMPVEGNVDEPDFKYGTLVLKTLGGLIAKAVTSPFKFLGSVMGFDAENFEYLNFEAGSATIPPPQREKLDQLSKMMLKKPKINLKLSAPYDAVYDKQALQFDKLIDLVMQKSGLKNRKEHESAMTIDLLEDIYAELQDDKVIDTIREELEKEYEGEALQRKYHNSLILLCRDIQELSSSALLDLANKRRQNIYDYMTQEKSINKNRFIKEKPLAVESESEESIAFHIQIEIK
ncbi:DUF748 domain-containing protein [Sulfurimonas sp. SAG-AH-194-C20]|nr:DUF748 domain-containing protein [Sulfurimonas sp. SAG-AH-194-C20]MDF1878034.1 DUF748 domain-containing protein [Sulfurimonas sp. SAG-AH-194-C20]